LKVQPLDVAITAGATEVVGQIAWATRPDASTNIVCIGDDFPSVNYPWVRVAEITGAEVHLATAGLERGRRRGAGAHVSEWTVNDAVVGFLPVRPNAQADGADISAVANDRKKHPQQPDLRPMGVVRLPGRNDVRHPWPFATS
jgi:hypothetical protein